MNTADEFDILTHQASRYIPDIHYTEKQFAAFVGYCLKLIPGANLIFTPLVEIPCLSSGSEYSDTPHNLLQDVPNMHIVPGFTEKMLLLKSKVIPTEANVLHLLLLNEKNCFVEVQIVFIKEYSANKETPPGHITVEHPRWIATRAEIVKKYNKHELPLNVAPESILQILARLIHTRTKELTELAHQTGEINNRVQNIIWTTGI